MADGNLVRQSNVGEGSVVFGPSVYDVPLLPYEKELIKTIGITEEEYCKFAAEVRRKGVVRPAEYAHIRYSLRACNDDRNSCQPSNQLGADWCCLPADAQAQDARGIKAVAA